MNASMESICLSKTNAKKKKLQARRWCSSEFFIYFVSKQNVTCYSIQSINLFISDYLSHNVINSSITSFNIYLKSLKIPPDKTRYYIIIDITPVIDRILTCIKSN